MLFDPSNPVVARCAAGMQVEGEPDKVRALFEHAWAARTLADRATVAVGALPADGYGQMLRGGIGRLVERIAAAEDQAISS